MWDVIEHKTHLWEVIKDPVVKWEIKKVATKFSPVFILRLASWEIEIESDWSDIIPGWLKVVSISIPV